MLREAYLLDAIEHSNVVEMFKLSRHMLVANIAANTRVTPEGMDNLLERSEDNYFTIARKLLPHWDWDKVENDKLDVDMNNPAYLRKLYEDAFKVNLDSPEIQAKLKQIEAGNGDSANV